MKDYIKHALVLFIYLILVRRFFIYKFGTYEGEKLKIALIAFVLYVLTYFVIEKIKKKINFSKNISYLKIWIIKIHFKVTILLWYQIDTIYYCFVEIFKIYNLEV